MSDQNNPLETLNVSELMNLIRRNTGVVVKRSLAVLRLRELAGGAQPPRPDEMSGTNETRRLLQVFIAKNWEMLNSQLPCTGDDRGKCTIYPCPEGRHLDCYGAAMRKKV